MRFSETFESRCGGRKDASDQLRRLLAGDLHEALLQGRAQARDLFDVDELLEGVHAGQFGALKDDGVDGRVVGMPIPMRVIGSAPNSRDLLVVSGKWSASKTCISPGSLVVTR